MFHALIFCNQKQKDVDMLRYGFIEVFFGFTYRSGFPLISGENEENSKFLSELGSNTLLHIFSLLSPCHKN